MPYPERMIKRANYWGLKIKSAIVKGEIKFPNQHGKKFDWENDELSKIEASRKNPRKFYQTS